MLNLMISSPAFLPAGLARPAARVGWVSRPRAVRSHGPLLSGLTASCYPVSQPRSVRSHSPVLSDLTAPFCPVSQPRSVRSHSPVLSGLTAPCCPFCQSHSPVLSGLTAPCCPVSQPRAARVTANAVSRVGLRNRIGHTAYSHRH